jgi:hypothetical protein
MALFNTPEYNARQNSGTPPRLPFQVPNFGEGPVGDTIVDGRIVTEAQRRADAQTALNELNASNAQAAASFT